MRKETEDAISGVAQDRAERMVKRERRERSAKKALGAVGGGRTTRIVIEILAAGGNAREVVDSRNVEIKADFVRFIVIEFF